MFASSHNVQVIKHHREKVVTDLICLYRTCNTYAKRDNEGRNKQFRLSILEDTM